MKRKRRRPPSYAEFNAVELFCPTCGKATPTRERLLLVLPDGDLYEYRCGRCGTSVGKKKAEAPIHPLVL
jgi:DNA-directed RNA polymerase subunit RPC12/RpoP